MDIQSKPNGQRAGILDKRIPSPSRTGSNDKSDQDSAYVSSNVQGCQSQDIIGWTEFLHGKVSTKMRRMQQAHCLLTNTNLNRDNWMVELTGKLIDISHSQWLYQNFTLHPLTKGYL
jgi:hypothetical protein